MIKKNTHKKFKSSIKSWIRFLKKCIESLNQKAWLKQQIDMNTELK